MSTLEQLERKAKQLSLQTRLKKQLAGYKEDLQRVKRNR